MRIRRVALTLIPLLLVGCGGGGGASAASPTPASPTESPGPTVSEQELADADILLWTGETRENLELGGYGFAQGSISSPGPTIRVESGSVVTLGLRNVHGYVDDEEIDHDFAVVAEKLEASPPLWSSRIDNLDPGQAGIVTFTPGEPGRYFYICTLVGHMGAHGMWGRFVVE